MPQPEYVPVTAADEVRPVERLPAPRSWRPDRPGDAHRGGPAPAGRARGVPGPDQGYGLRLLHLFEDRLVPGDDESIEDIKAAGLAVALKRAALFGRAPVVHDLEHAFTLWGCLGEAPEDLVEYRTALWRGAAHHYWDQRMIVDRVPEATLRLSPAEVASRLESWRTLIDAA